MKMRLGCSSNWAVARAVRDATGAEGCRATLAQQPASSVHNAGAVGTSSPLPKQPKSWRVRGGHGKGYMGLASTLLYFAALPP